MLQTEKVGMKELDRHLGRILKTAQRMPVAVHRRGAPWIWLVTHGRWRRPDPWTEMIPAGHPLYGLREHVDARLELAEDRYAALLDDSLPPGVLALLLRATIYRTIHQIEDDRYFHEQLSYHVLCRWFVGLPDDFGPLARFVQEADALRYHEAAPAVLAELLDDAPLARFPARLRLLPSIGEEEAAA